MADYISKYTGAEIDDAIGKVNNKVDKVSGKGLSTNDYTSTDKEKVNKIITSGNGTKFLSNDGTYKTVEGGGSGVGAINFTDDGAGNVEITASGGTLNFTDDGNGNITLGVA